MTIDRLGLALVFGCMALVNCGGESDGDKKSSKDHGGQAGEPPDDGRSGEWNQAGESTSDSGGTTGKGGQSADVGGTATAGGETAERGGQSTGGGGPATNGGRDGSGGSTGGAGLAGGGNASLGGEAANNGGSLAAGGSSAGAPGLGGTAGAVQLEDKMDILFVLDNSLSMGDKQAVLVESIPSLLEQLTNPDCVDDPAQPTQRQPGVVGQACPVGMDRERRPLRDLHIGFVTSSLGDFGGDLCPAEPEGLASEDDHGWLLGALPRVTGTNAQLATFLDWSDADTAGGDSQLTAKEGEFRSFVASAGEIGCGLEMTLEAWVRFLVDPAPPEKVDHVDPTLTTSNISRQGTDTTLLEQRNQFLRQDSLLSIVMLTDENDCSLRDTGIAWLTSMGRSPSGSGRFYLEAGSTACDTDPNDPCCYSCMLASPPTGCEADSRCLQEEGATLNNMSDPLNLRCLNQKARFGIDLLFPTSRYVNALTLTQLCPDQTYGDFDCDCTEAQALGVACDANPNGLPESEYKFPNPLYVGANMSSVRNRMGPSQVFLVGIVGVPWQDLSTEDSITSEELRYRRASEMDWSLVLPGGSGEPPRDPLMVESPLPREGTHPVTGEDLVGIDGAVAANSINGHEWDTLGQDLQYACIFDLRGLGEKYPDSVLRDCDAFGDCYLDPTCTDNCESDQICLKLRTACMCRTNPTPSVEQSNPLCQDPETGSYGTIPYFGKAYPSLRPLTVLRDYAAAVGQDNAIAGSICPKNLDPNRAGEASYGYNPAFHALIERLDEVRGR